ncbi:MAG: acyl carrier protein [Prevotella sp.]
MTRQEIIEQVNSVIAAEFEINANDIMPEANIKDTLGIDSLSLVDLVALVQQLYKLIIPLEDLKKIVTFEHLYDYIEQHAPKD